MDVSASTSGKWCPFSTAHRPGGRCQGHAIGNFIMDFCAPRKKLVIEVDGSQHIEQEEYDTERTRFLESQGYEVLRFWNNEIMKDIKGVMRAILEALEERSIR